MDPKKVTDSSYEEVMRWLEEEYMYDDELELTSPYKPLNFHDPNEVDED